MQRQAQRSPFTCTRGTGFAGPPGAPLKGGFGYTQ